MPRNPVEEFVALKKTAGPWSNFGTNVQHAAAGGLATAVVGAGVAGLGVAAHHIFDAATKSHDFKQMLAANEDLHEHYNADPKRFNMMYSTLRTMNPEFSKDPLVAGAFMRQMHDSPTGIGGIASEALKHRRDFPDHIMESFTAGGREGARTGLAGGLKREEQQFGYDLGANDRDIQHKMTAKGLELNQRTMMQREKHFGAQQAQNKAQFDAGQAEQARRDALQRQFQQEMHKQPQHEESDVRDFDASGNQTNYKETRKKSWR